MKNVKKVIVKAAEKSFVTMADLFSTIMCRGRGYEPKVPEKLKK